MEDLAMKRIITSILLLNSFGLSQIEDSHGGDFVVVTGTTTYESLPFIEEFSNGNGQNFDDWVTAQFYGTTNLDDDYDCLDSPCDGNDIYVSSLTPPDSFFLSDNEDFLPWGVWSSPNGFTGNTTVKEWYRDDDSQARFEYSHIRGYRTSLYSPLINISGLPDLRISFDLYFDGWEGTDTDEYLEVEYCTGSGWENGLTFLADPAFGDADIPWTTNVFFLYGLRDLDTLQIRFRTHGDFSYNINDWYIDNVNIYAAPVLSTVSISGPVENPEGAINGDQVTITMESNTDLLVPPTVIMNGDTVTTIASGTDFSATKEITDADPEGPIPSKTKNRLLRFY